MLKVMYFTTTVGTEHQQIPFETAGSVKFFEVLNEIAKKLNLSSEGIAVAPPGGAALVYTDYQLTVDEVIKNVEGCSDNFDPIIRYHTFNDFSIDFSVIFRIKEYPERYRIKHEFIKRLHERYNKEGIEIPFPMRTIQMLNNK